MPIIHVHDLSKTYTVADRRPGLWGAVRHLLRRRYKAVHAVRSVTFSIEPGEIVGFLGPNGAGKTTTLKMLTGLIHPTAGAIDVAGHRPFSRDAAFLRRITLVMGQKQQLLWDLPARDSLRINAAVYEIPRDEFRRRVDEMASMLGMEKMLATPVRKLSLGERMKAELMAALLHRPDILFLDEPTLGLDINAQAAVRAFLHEYNRQFRATVLLTSHYMADITALCPRVILIHEGQLIHDGSLDAIRLKLAPYREVRIELTNPHHGQDFSRFGEVALAEERQVRLLVRRDVLARTIARVMDELDVADLTVTDPPIDEVIGKIFKEGVAAITGPPTPTPMP